MRRSRSAGDIEDEGAAGNRLKCQRVAAPESAVLVEPVQAEEPEAEAAEVGGQEGEEPPVEAEEAADEDEEGSDERDSLGEGESEERDEYEDGDEGADDVEYDEEGFLEEDGYDDAPERAVGTAPEPQAGDALVTPGVWARRMPDGRHCLLGAPLRYAPKLLRRIFGFSQQRGQLLWRRQEPIDDEAWRYTCDALAAPRIQPLLQSGRRVLEPLPAWGFPASLRLKDSRGDVLQGPKRSGSGAMSYNVGRQFFSSFNKGVDGSFFWADGVGPFDPEAQQSFNDAM
ncbi:hypothetical protein MNEG_1296 [Monoraphidium neglectum]|uniref:Uncharacterized protein n=1 Tax=Monoraphidium neglectum TaxID=145388 RepID=A0A0D2K931_9CHLO|nr:hypothetical protein MNEG_1296 [Monoraphidium neglectum]KIZ06663.1 hypothetical protein MNEG_1296 [Monoraphidium neglectum]|eukprot:XP_013905682.1 hypothetical protein MNEG_1296 [Monoraphidium neglectum]